MYIFTFSDCCISSVKKESEETWFDDALKFQQWANSVSSTVMRIASRHFDLAKRCKGLQKTIQTLTNQQQDLALKETQMRQQILQLKDELDAVKNAEKNKTNCQVVGIEGGDSEVVIESSDQEETNVDMLSRDENQTKSRKRKASNKSKNTQDAFTDVVSVKKKIRQKRITSSNLGESHNQESHIAQSGNKTPRLYHEVILDRTLRRLSSWENKMSELRETEVPIMEIYKKSSCRKYSFPAFPCNAVQKALSSTEPFLASIVDDVLFWEKWDHGKILFAKKVFSPKDKMINRKDIGFAIFDESIWHHNLLEYKKQGKNVYKFITMHCGCKTSDGTSDEEERHKQKLDPDSIVFGIDEKPLTMEKDKIYVQTATKNITFSDSHNPKIRAKELIIVRVHNDKSKQWLVNSAAYQFYMLIKDDIDFVAAPWLLE